MFSVGLVGLPNAGKSTLFNLLTNRTVPAENFPFCTIDPNDGVVEVPDLRIKKLAELVNAKKEVYSLIEFRDIAGLVKNASKGEGLGNKFLGHILEVDLILMVVRCFENSDIIHVENRVDPKEDEEILLLELILSDLERLKKTILRLEKEGKKDPNFGEKMDLVKDLLMALEKGEVANLVRPELSSNSTDKTIKDSELFKFRRQLNLLTDKQILRVGNISKEGENKNYDSDFVLDIFEESTLADLSLEERKELGVEGKTGLDKMIQSCYQKLNLASFLTCGEIEARSWSFTKGMSAPECAGKIHTDFEKKFIKVEVVKYSDFVQAESWKNCFEKGLVKTQGKDYLMEDGDVVNFKIGG
jgi:ribosome-binding ATPase